MDIVGRRKRSRVKIKNLVVVAELQVVGEEEEGEGLFMVWRLHFASNRRSENI